MKKLPVLALVFVLTALSADAQVYYDAIAIAKLTNPTKDPDSSRVYLVPKDATQKTLKDLIEILVKYLPENEVTILQKLPTTKEKYTFVQEKLQANPFISLPTVVQDFRGIDLGPLTKSGGLLDQGLSAVSGANISTYADGFAKFLVERVKQELTITFFTKFKEDLQKSQDLRILFPNTYNWLQSIEKEIYNYSSYLTMLREAFIKDFQTIIPNLKRVVNDPRYDDFFSKNIPLRSLFLSALIITEDLQKGLHPGEIVHHLSMQDFGELDQVEQNIKPSFRTLDLLIQSIRSKSNDHYTVPLDSVRTGIFLNEINFNIFLGLIFQKAEGINFNIGKKTKALKVIMRDASVEVNLLKAFKEKYVKKLEEISYQVEEVHATVTRIRMENKSPDTKATYKEYYQFYDQTMGLLESISGFADLTGFKWTSKKDTYFFVARKMGESYLDVNEKKYATVILNFAIVYDTLFLNRKLYLKNEILLFEEKLKSVLETEKKELERQLALLKEEQDQMDGQVTSKLLKYGNFAAQVANAENSDQVSDIIESIALPAGSARIKRQTHFNVSVNSFVSFYGGNEYHLYTADGVNTAQRQSSGGLMAPIGLAFSKGFRSRDCELGSLSLFTSVVDLAAFVSFRFGDDATADLPEVTLANIISPGAFLIYGIPNTPISIGYGWQYGPSLRKIDSQAATITNEKYYGWRLFIGVDIPIFNLTTKPR